MNKSRRVKRAYRSEVRAAQAEGTRLAVLQAAGRLFVERGYVATSIDSIAAAAGVSRATVFASGKSKPALLKAAYDVALVGDARPIALPDRPASRRVMAEPDPRRYLEGYARIAGDGLRRIAPIYEVVRAAARATPEVEAVWQKVNEERRIGAGNIVRHIQERDALRAGLDAEAAADVVWVLIEPSVYHQLVYRRGWPHERYVSWLAGVLERELL